jgi:uncharacterized membrane protein
VASSGLAETPPAGSPVPGPRLISIDALRGAVMIIMALDHVRDFVHAGAMTFSPEDLARTTPFLFFTRWVTHICAPTFFLLAGFGAFFRLQRTGSKNELSWFLLSRGLWLIVIELTLMRLAMNFTFSSAYPLLLLILWALGLAMVALAALIHLPPRVLAVVALAIIASHNLLDGIQARQLGDYAPLWNILHQQGVFRLAGMVVVVAYPLLPWIGVMAAGFCAGELFWLEPAQRRRAFVTIGVASLALFAALRGLNGYGDPAPWSGQSTMSMTVVSFFRVTKYPPSLDFLLMTLGPAFLALAALDGRYLSPANPLLAIGRVPFFYYVIHFWLIHLVASAMAWIRYGTRSFAYMFHPLPSMGGPRQLFPPDFGYPLWVTYAVWIGVVCAMYPLCLWFSRLKARRREWWLSYL